MERLGRPGPGDAAARHGDRAAARTARRHPRAAALPLEEIGVPAPPLDADARRALEAAVGQRARDVRTDAESRIRHTRGKSTPDLLRMRAGDVTDTPAAVVLPDGHDEVLAVLAACAEHGLALVPFGGGTSVVGGLAPGREGAFVALDLRRMNRLLDLDEVSRTATLQPGLRAPEAEALLAEHGYTLGHFPQSYEWATVGGFAATRSSGQASAGYGRFDEMVLGLTLATPGARSTPAAHRARPPDPTCASSSWARRAPSASSPPSPCAYGPLRRSAATRAGASPPSTRAPPPCAASPRTVRAPRCCGCPTRPRP